MPAWKFARTLAVVLLCLGSASCGSRGAKQQPPRFDATRAVASARHQCAFGPRVPGSAARDSVAAYIARTLAGRGAQVEQQRFSVDDPWGDGRLELINVVGRYEPERKRRVIIASHYDSRPWADQDTTEALRKLPVPGAVDGAASTGILLELARLMGEQSVPDYGVDLVFFDGEDYGRPEDLSNYLLGSKHFVATLGDRRPEFVILIDLVGGRNTRIAREGYSLANSPDLVDAVFARAAALGLSTFLNAAAPSIYDDHVPFIEAGIEAIDVFGYGYPEWHTTRDLPDQIDRGRVDEVGRLLASLLYTPPE